MTATALEIQNLRVELPTSRGLVRAIDDVSLSVDRGEVVGIVGESGCGKTTLALSMLRLLPHDAVTSGSIHLDGVDVLGAGRSQLLALRRGHMAYVPQDPLVSLDPTFTVGAQVAETIRAQESGISRRESRHRAIDLMNRVGIRGAAHRYHDAPHHFSGGMRQRIAIAIAMSARPSLIVADEPTTALDVTVQRQILELLVDLATENGTALCLITHDLGVVADTCDRVVVLYAGRVAEHGPLTSVLDTPRHPYTRALLEATPRASAPRGHLPTIPGGLPDPVHLPSGCAFAARCPRVIDACAQAPPLTGTPHAVACWSPGADNRSSGPVPIGEEAP